MSAAGPVTAEVWKQAAIVERFLSFHAAIPLAREQTSVMLTLLATRQEPIKSFIDLGCGDGILVQLKDFAEQLQLLNLDYADSLWSHIISSLRQVQGGVDAIVSRYSIHHQPDERKRAIYAEIFNLLAPGGWFINIEHILPSAPLATDLLNDHIIDGRFAIEQQNGGSKTRQEIADIFLNRPDREANLLTPVDTQCDWLREIGFDLVDCYFHIYELAVFAGRRPNRKS